MQPQRHSVPRSHNRACPVHQIFVRVSKSPLVMDGLIRPYSVEYLYTDPVPPKGHQTVHWVRFEPGLLYLLSSKEFHESELQRNSPWTSLRPETVLSWKDNEEPAE